MHLFTTWPIVLHFHKMLKINSSQLCTVYSLSEALIFIKFIYSEQATKFCEIFTLLLTTVHTVKSKVKTLQNFVTFSEYMNFTFSISEKKNWIWKSINTKISFGKFEFWLNMELIFTNQWINYTTELMLQDKWTLCGYVRSKVHRKAR